MIGETKASVGFSDWAQSGRFPTSGRPHKSNSESFGFYSTIFLPPPPKSSTCTKTEHRSSVTKPSFRWTLVHLEHLMPLMLHLSKVPIDGAHVSYISYISVSVHCATLQLDTSQIHTTRRRCKKWHMIRIMMRNIVKRNLQWKIIARLSCRFQRDTSYTYKYKGIPW